MPRINFSMCVNKNVKPSAHQGIMRSTLNLLPLPTPALPGSGACWSLVSSQWSLVNHALFTNRNNGFDLSLSFSLVNMLQHIIFSKARHPLRIMGQRYFFISKFGCSISDLFDCEQTFNLYPFSFHLKKLFLQTFINYNYAKNTYLRRIKY